MDKWIYLAHALCWSVFLLRGRRSSSPEPAPPAPATSAPHKARHPTLLVALHGLGFGVMYFGIGAAAFSPPPVPRLFPPQVALGGALIALAALLTAWTLRVFHSWRLRAQLDVGHRLSTDGPFRYVRHPIYLAMALLGLGSFLWIATPIVGVGALLMALAGDLRARSEEKLLIEAYADDYRNYQRRSRRFVPGVY